MSWDPFSSSGPESTDSPASQSDEESPAAPADDPADALLPVPATTSTEDIEDRTYIEVRPSEMPVDPSAAFRAMTQLQARLRENTPSGLRAWLPGTPKPPVVEWLLVADGRPDARVRYLVGASTADALDDAERVLRSAFPTSYELKRVETHPRHVEEHLSPVPVDEPERPATTVHPGAAAAPGTTPYAAGVSYVGQTDRNRDWQTGLTTYEEFVGSTTRSRGRSRSDGNRDTPSTAPLATLVATLADADTPALFQVVCRPHPDWTAAADVHADDLQEGTVTTGDRVLEALMPRDQEERRQHEPPLSDRERLESIQRRQADRSFCVAARAVALTWTDPAEADRVARQLSAELDILSGPSHKIRGVVRTDESLEDTDGPGQAVYDALCARECPAPTYDQRLSRLRPGLAGSRGMVVDPAELPGLCLIDGAGLTNAGQRALAIRRGERASLPLPERDQLTRYDPPGQLLCMPLDSDRQPTGDPLCLPPELQSRHTVVTGDTGSGKSVLMLTAMLSNVPATEGPELLFDYKGDGMARNYLRAHYAVYGDLEDILYFDLTEALPALSVLDATPLLDAGLPREEARSRLTGHFEEVVASLMGAETYERAPEAVRALRNHLRALYDPVHGDDAVSVHRLYDRLQRTLRREVAPPVTDPALQSYFDTLLERDRDVFNRVVGAAASRVETVVTDARIAPLFDYIHSEDGPSLAFSDLIDEDTVVVFDFGGMETRAKQALTLGVLSSLWMALRARSEGTATTADPAQVNLYLDDAKDVVDTSLMETLLAQGRSFGLSLMLGVQYPGQLESPDPEDDTYRELLNETATWVVGNVGTSDDLADVLATEAMGIGDVNRRLSAMRRGEWLVRPGTGFGEATPRPFLGQSLPAPRGHPASAAPLSEATEDQFRTATKRGRERTRDEYGITHGEPDVDLAETEGEPDVGASSFMTGSEEAAGEPAVEADSAADAAQQRLDSLLPYTERLPDCLIYDEDPHALRCEQCGNRYDPTIDGLTDAVGCCHDLAGVDRDNIPVCAFNLKLTPEEVAASEWDLRQLLFLQAVYNAQQRRYHHLEYDIIRDSMIRLQEYVGIDTDAVDKLLDAGLLRHDSDHPHRLYSVAPDGREVVGESYREGVEYGHGAGDLEESSEHVLGIALGERYLQHAYVDDPESPVTEVSPYHEVTVDGTQRRLDIAGIDADGEIVVAVEVERLNHDYRRAVLEDFDKMAACDVAEAIWIVMTQDDAHELLEVLNDPVDGDPRVEKTYARTTRVPQFQVGTAGLTDIRTVDRVLKTVDKPHDPRSA
jgi:hypothetical protein